jgi:hypothetical protein
MLSIKPYDNAEAGAKLSLAIARPLYKILIWHLSS